MDPVAFLPTDFAAVLPELFGIGEELLQRGTDNVSTREIIQKYTLNAVPHLEVLDLHLQLRLLHIVAWTGDAETIRELRNCADPEAKTAGGFTALHLAASRGHFNALSELLSWPGADWKGSSSDEGLTALHLAAYGGDCKSVQLLLGVSDLNSKDEVFGRTALHFAAQRGHKEVVNLLTSVSGVDVHTRDRVRDSTPFLLAAMQPKDRCNVNVIKKLLEVNSEQVNDKVGILNLEMSNKIASYFDQVWRELTLIKMDSSMRPTHAVEEKVDEDEMDLYRRFAVPMDGHTALHLAATQNNAELVSHLASSPGVKLNEKDTMYGMTPLHCLIRTGAMEAFDALMEFDEVNVNAKLVKGGQLQCPVWRPRGLKLSDESWIREMERFRRFETPVHLAIRVCSSKDLLHIVNVFFNYPTFNSAIYNENLRCPLDLLWYRLSGYPVPPSIFRVRKAVSADPRLVPVETFQYVDRYLVERVASALEVHPSNGSKMNVIAETRKTTHDSLNAFLVTATLLGGVTFRAYLQPPFGEGLEDYRSRPARLFWAFNSLSFYFAVYTILRSLLCIARGDERSDYAWDRTWNLGMVRIQNAVPLGLSVGLGIGAFAAAGYANLPPDSKSLMLACTLSGLLLVSFQFFRNLVATVSFVMYRGNLNPDDNIRSQYIFWLSSILLGPLYYPLIYRFQRIDIDRSVFKITSAYKFRVLKDGGNLAFVGTQLWLVVAVVLYALAEA